MRLRAELMLFCRDARQHGGYRRRRLCVLVEEEPADEVVKAASILGRREDGKYEPPGTGHLCQNIGNIKWHARIVHAGGVEVVTTGIEGVGLDEATPAGWRNQRLQAMEGGYNTEAQPQATERLARWHLPSPVLDAPP